jgi:hypothetical protein
VCRVDKELQKAAGADAGDVASAELHVEVDRRGEFVPQYDRSEKVTDTCDTKSPPFWPRIVRNTRRRS